MDLEEKLEQKDKEVMEKEKIRMQQQQQLEMLRDKLSELTRKEKEMEAKLEDSRVQSQQVRACWIDDVVVSLMNHEHSMLDIPPHP